jgi:hypothetical protein
MNTVFNNKRKYSKQKFSPLTTLYLILAVLYIAPYESMKNKND